MANQVWKAAIYYNERPGGEAIHLGHEHLTNGFEAEILTEDS
jgi:hypothetical protein